MDGGHIANCRYHTDQTARWFCASCDLNLCSRCKPKAAKIPVDINCPLCGEPMHDLAIGKLFWTSPQDHLAYPLGPTMLIFIGALTLAGMLVPAGFALFVFFVVALVTSCWVGFHVFRASSQGQGEPPPVSALIDFKQFDAFKPFLGVALILFGLVAAGWWLVPILFAPLLTILVAALLPASLMLASIDGELKTAFDFESLYQLGQRLGVAYIVLSVLVLFLMVTPAALLVPLSSVLPEWLHRGLLILLQSYAILLIFRYIGVALFQNQRSLGHDTKLAPGRRVVLPEPEEYEPDLAISTATIQHREGMNKEARWTLGQALTRYPNHPTLNDQFEQLLIADEDHKELTSHINRRLKKLSADRDKKETVDTWLRVKPALTDWLPTSSSERHWLGHALAEQGQEREGLRVLLSLPKDDPKYRRLPEACMSAADIMEKSLGDSAGAEKLRDFVRKKFPGRYAD
jgi:hypothetical protein